MKSVNGSAPAYRWRNGAPQHGIGTDAYTYRLHVVRKECLEASAPSSFTELPQPAVPSRLSPLSDSLSASVGGVSLELGVDGLAALIRQELRLNPFAPNTLYLFCGRRSDRIKCLTYEEDGFFLLYKRVADGSFRWPRTPQEVRDLSYEDFYRLMDGKSLEKSIRKFTPKML